MNKTSHIQVLRTVKDMKGIEVEVDYSKYYDGFDAAREFFDSGYWSESSDDCSPYFEELGPFDGLEPRHDSDYDYSDGSEFYEDTTCT